MQKNQNEWKWQWENLSNENQWLFLEWIYPNSLEDFKNKTVLDCGCGAGDHLYFVGDKISYGLGIDLNSDQSALAKNRQNKNIKIINGDIATIKLDDKFDIVYSIGVLHHTVDPTLTFNNIKSLAKRGGKVIVWVYAFEGNFLNRVFLEFFKKYFFSKLSRKILWGIAVLLTSLMYIPIYTIYLLPLKFLPFYEYFQNWRIIGFKQNKLNVFDKLNAPTTHFLKREILENWFNERDFSSIHISAYKGVSWRASGLVK